MALKDLPRDAVVLESGDRSIIFTPPRTIHGKDVDGCASEPPSASASALSRAFAPPGRRPVVVHVKGCTVSKVGSASSGVATVTASVPAAVISLLLELDEHATSYVKKRVNEWFSHRKLTEDMIDDYFRSSTIQCTASESVGSAGGVATTARWAIDVSDADDVSARLRATMGRPCDLALVLVGLRFRRQQFYLLWRAVGIVVTASSTSGNGNGNANVNASGNVNANVNASGSGNGNGNASKARSSRSKEKVQQRCEMPSDGDSVAEEELDDDVFGPDPEDYALMRVKAVESLEGVQLRASRLLKRLQKQGRPDYDALSEALETSHMVVSSQG
jgi:hypothetical protein